MIHAIAVFGIVIALVEQKIILFIIREDSLTTGHTTSCGCRIKEVTTKHKGYGTRLYRIWMGMKCRCFNKNDTGYSNYGGRGIIVCDEWKNDFAAFRDWAMKNGYDKNAGRFECTIDRINNDGNYELSNRRWVSIKVQSGNKKIMFI